MEQFNLITNHDTSWHKHVMEKHVLPDQAGFLSGQNLSLAGQNDLLTDKNYLRSCSLLSSGVVKIVNIFLTEQLGVSFFLSFFQQMKLLEIKFP